MRYKKFIWVLIALLGLTPLAPIFGQSNCPVLSTNYPDCFFTAIGHRGWSHLYPENSLQAIKEAFKHGIKYCEIDVSLTRDGQYVLFHDFKALHRTTQGDSQIDQITWDELKLLDAGSWKEVYFSDTRVALLKDALQLAQDFDAYLYLDTKDYSPEKLKDLLKESGVGPERMVLPLELHDLDTFNKYLPQSQWIWYKGGLFPDDPSSDAFYEACKNNGCLALEVSWYQISIDPSWPILRDKAAQHGIPIWAFTVSTGQRARALVEKGVAGLETDRPTLLQATVCDSSQILRPDSLTTGNWRFQSGLRDVVGPGSQVRKFRYLDSTHAQDPDFLTCQEAGISGIESSEDSIMRVPAQDPERGLLVYTNFSTEDQGNEDFTYSWIMDFLLPQSSVGKWVALYQTSISNTNDAELFINPDGRIGVINEYFDTIRADTWYRLAVVYDGVVQELRLFLDGTPLGIISTYGDRWAVYNSGSPLENQGFRWLTDDDGETAELFISALQVRNYCLSAGQLSILGGVDKGGIPLGNAQLFLKPSQGLNMDSSLLDYHSFTWHAAFEPGLDLGSVPLNYVYSTGAKVSKASGESWDLNGDAAVIQVTSQDGLHHRTWKICGAFLKTSVEWGSPYIDSPNLIGIKPNPASCVVELSWDSQIGTGTIFKGGTLETDSGCWTIYGSDGRQVYAYSGTGIRQQLDVSQWKPGVYRVVFRHESGKYHAPLLVH